MTYEEAEQILSNRQAAGANVIAAHEADWTTIKRLRSRCLEAGFPAMLGECPGGG